MKVFSISNFDSTGKIVRHVANLSAVGYFERKALVEFTKFSSKTIYERTNVGRHTIVQGDYLIHVAKMNDNRSCIIITDIEYPERVAQVFASENINKGDEMVIDWETIQDPSKIDKVFKIQTELDDTMIVLHDTIEKVLERGEKLDDIVKRSSELSTQSKLFYTATRKNNRCCLIN